MPYTPAMDAKRRIQPLAKKSDKKADFKGKNRIRVVVRKRPIKKGEPGGDIVACDGGARCVRVEEAKKRLDLSTYTETHAFVFDEAFSHEDSTEDVYESSARTLLDTFVSGGNASCFAYGQTGSGKTHTMLGDAANEGLYILAARDLFKRKPGDVEVYASMFEIYCEKLYDLVHGRNQVFAREGADGVVKICGLTEHRVGGAQDVLRLVSSSSQYRASGSTAANSRSSRSHAILRLALKRAGDSAEMCHMSFVDLAGSERGADTADRDKKTRREGSEINKSLLALKECIRGLDMGHKHVKFRGSKLTEVLKASFQGNCRTCMIATVSPAGHDAEHSMNTLRYAHRVKSLPPVKVSSGGNRRMTPPSNLPQVARPPPVSDDATPAAPVRKRRTWSKRVRGANGPCAHCGAATHHTLLCRKPMRLRAGNLASPDSSSSSNDLTTRLKTAPRRRTHRQPAQKRRRRTSSPVDSPLASSFLTTSLSGTMGANVFMSGPIRGLR